MKIDLNCDLGEGYGTYRIGNDEKIMPYITSANIACGFHAGDSMTMAKTVNMAKKHGVAVGAHPGFPDLLGFGRREMHVTFEEAENYTIHQIGALLAFAKTAGVKLQHVKPHGALYNIVAKDEELSKAIVKATKAIGEDLIVFASPKSALAKVAVEAGLRVAHEFFADRSYNPDGTLVSRDLKDAVIQKPKKVVESVVRAVKEGRVLAVNGSAIKLGKLHTICVHGDTQGAVNLARLLKNELSAANVEIEPVSNFI